MNIHQAARWILAVGTLVLWNWGLAMLVWWMPILVNGIFVLVWVGFIDNEYTRDAR